MKRSCSTLLLYLALSISSFTAVGQTVSQLEYKLEDAHGVERLEILNQLAALYLKEDDDHQALRAATQATELADNFFNATSIQLYPEKVALHAQSYLQLGEIYVAREKYFEGEQSFEYARSLAQKYDDTESLLQADELLAELSEIDYEESNRKPPQDRNKLGDKLKTAFSDVDYNSKLRTAESAREKGDYLKSIESYTKAIQILEDRGDFNSINEIQVQVGELYQLVGEKKLALDQYEAVLDRKEALADTTGLKALAVKLVRLRGKQSPAGKGTKPVAMKPELKDSVIKEKDKYESMAKELEGTKDYKRSLEYYKLYTELNKKLTEEEQQRQLDLLEKTYEIDRQAQQVAMLKADKEIQDLKLVRKDQELLQEYSVRRKLIIGSVALLVCALLLSIGSVSLFRLYRSKKNALQELHTAYDKLEQTQFKLIKAEERVKELLDQQVSHGVAKQLLLEEQGSKVQKKFVCIMFLDIRNFTPFVEHKKPEEIIDYQNKIFGFMIDIIDQHDGIINQFLGDGFMATFGLTDSHNHVCQNAYNAAQKILVRLRDSFLDGSIPETHIGIGLHAGSVVAGNVGTDVRKQYSITGNTVILASRLEQMNKTYNSNLVLSEEVFEQLDAETRPDNPQFIEVQVKGRAIPIRILAIAEEVFDNKA